LLLAEGLHVFRMPTPERLTGKTLAESGIRETTGCSVVALIHDGKIEINPVATVPLESRTEIVIIGDAESESRFHASFG
jgi:K+/H+ antiporter YhaU regulatory subunit KhtT